MLQGFIFCSENQTTLQKTFSCEARNVDLVGRAAPVLLNPSESNLVIADQNLFDF